MPKVTTPTKKSPFETVGVVGLGYVGLPLVLSFARKGMRVVGFDIDADKITKLERGERYIKHIEPTELKAFFDQGRFVPTTDFARARDCDAVLICVPTPLGKNREPDLSFVLSTGRSLGPFVKRDMLVVLESTTYPGTTDEDLKDVLEETSGLKAGVDFHLAFSPEREDPGNPSFETKTIPKLVGATTPRGLELAVALYRIALDRVIPVSSTRVAETAKVLENVFRAVNIALVNELKILCDKMGIDVWEVIDAAASKPFGFMPFYPGPGLGGHCIPIDPFYLTWKAREYGLTTRFIELAGEVNAGMPHYVVERTAEALNRHKKAVNGSEVLVLGIAYKRDVDDVRESPALEVIELFQERGASVSYHDPYIPRTHRMRAHDLGMESVELTDARLAAADAVVIVTDHTNLDYGRVLSRARLVVDSRNAVMRAAAAGRLEASVLAEHREKLVKA